MNYSTKVDGFDNAVASGDIPLKEKALKTGAISFKTEISAPAQFYDYEIQGQHDLSLELSHIIEGYIYDTY